MYLSYGKDNRWSLFEAIFFKTKGSPFDQFFSSNKGAPLLEINIYAGAGSFENKSDDFLLENHHGNASVSGGFLYFSFVGVEADFLEFEKIKTKKYRLHLRILGDSEQNTHLSLFYGQRTSNNL